MGLQTALHAAKSALLANAAQTAIVSRNIAGASESNYARRIMLVESSVDGVKAGSVERSTDSALRDALLGATSASASNVIVSSALTGLQQTVGDPQSQQSPAALIGALQTALMNAAAAPQDSAALGAAVDAARTIVSSLNSATTQIQDARAQADAGMAAAVEKINALLAEFGNANSKIVAGLKIGADVSDAQDRRDALLSDLAGQIGVKTVLGRDGGMAIYTDSGATLFQNGARQVRLTPTAAYVAGVAGSSLMVDGVSVAGISAAMPTQSGAIAGYARVRDQLAPTYQAQIDEMARGLVSAFAQRDQTGGAAPDRTGVFTWSGGPALPTGPVAGLGGQIAVDATVDPLSGGDVRLLRDGAIGANASVYAYNANGSAYFSGRLTGLADALGAQQSFSSPAGGAVFSSVIDFATNAVAWLEGRRHDAAEASAQSDSLASQAKSALGNATGVNIDDQMTRMLDLENNYQASAKMIATVDTLYSALFNAIAVRM